MPFFLLKKNMAVPNHKVVYRGGFFPLDERPLCQSSFQSRILFLTTDKYKSWHYVGWNQHTLMCEADIVSPGPLTAPECHKQHKAMNKEKPLFTEFFLPRLL